MIIAQELSHAASHSSDVTTIAIASLALATVIVRGLIDLITKLRLGDEQSNAELGRRVLALERGRREVEGAVSETRTEIAVVLEILKRIEQ